MAQIDIDLSDVKETGSFELLPDGEYEAVITQSEANEGAKGTYIKWTFELIGTNRKVWDYMSLTGIVGRQRLKALAIAAGAPNPNFVKHSEELHEKPLIIKIGNDKNDENRDKSFSPKNKIIGFKKLDRAGNTKSKTTAADELMPWER